MDSYLEKWKIPKLAITSKFKTYLLGLDQEKRALPLRSSSAQLMHSAGFQIT